MDIDIFEQLEAVAKSDSNDERVSLRRFQKKDSYRELGLIENQIIELEKQEQDLSQQDKDLMEKIQTEEKQKMDLVRQLYKIDESYDIDILTTENEKLLSEKSKLEKQLKEDKEYKETLRPLYMEYHEKLAKIDEEKIQNDYEEYKELRSKLRDSEANIKILESKIKSLKEHLTDLNKFEYDENCEYCIKNG